MIRCLVFDFDGVLVDSNEVKRDAFFRIFEEFGEPGRRWVRETLERDVDSDRFQNIRSVLAQAIISREIDSQANVDELIAKYAVDYNAICEEHASTCSEIPGAGSALRAFSARYPLYVISATIEDPLRRIVRLRGWEGYCKGVFGRPGTKIEHLHKVLKLESISPEEILFVGDGKRDIDAARSVGCRFIGIRNAFNDFETRGVKMLADLRPLEDAVEELDAEMVVDLPSR